MYKQDLFDYVKDHVQHFGFFPYDYENIKTGKIVKYPNYLNLFNTNEIEVLHTLFNKAE